MNVLMELMTGFGLAGGAGAKAFIPLLALGLFHHTPWFKLSPQFDWLAKPQVLAVVAILLGLELWLDAHPDLGHFSDVLAYLPKVAAGFLAFAAAVGSLDDNLLKLAGSGALGAVTAAGAHWMRNRVRRPIRDGAEQAHGSVSKVVTCMETGFSATASGLAILVPMLALLVLLAGLLIALWWVRRGDARRVPCVHCGQPVRPGALACPHCRGEQGEAGESVSR